MVSGMEVAETGVAVMVGEVMVGEVMEGAEMVVAGMVEIRWRAPARECARVTKCVISTPGCAWSGARGTRSVRRWCVIPREACVWSV